MQDEDRSLIRVEAAKAALELVSVGQIEVRVALRRLASERGDVDLDGSPPLAAALPRDGRR